MNATDNISHSKVGGRWEGAIRWRCIFRCELDWKIRVRPASKGKLEEII